MSFAGNAQAATLAIEGQTVTQTGGTITATTLGVEATGTGGGVGNITLPTVTMNSSGQVAAETASGKTINITSSDGVSIGTIGNSTTPLQYGGRHGEFHGVLGDQLRDGDEFADGDDGQYHGPADDHGNDGGFDGDGGGDRVVGFAGGGERFDAEPDDGRIGRGGEHLGERRRGGAEHERAGDHDERDGACGVDHGRGRLRWTGV